MKHLLFAGLAATFMACNNNPDDTTHRADTPGHATHGSDANTTTNEIKATMDRMMHDMHGVKPTGNNDVDFAAMMVEHHRGAVEMSRVLLDKGTDTALKGFGQKVIDDQQKEITMMQEFISKSSKTASSNATEFQQALNGSMTAMMQDTTEIYNNIDKDYAAQMIPHHQSAVDMAKAYLQYGKDKSLRTLCDNIIASQTKEIAWLKQWLAKN